MIRKMLRDSKIAMIVSSRNIVGKQIMTSTRRMIARSTHPW